MESAILETELVKYSARDIFPQIEDLDPTQRETLPPNVTHLEWEEFKAFGKICYRLKCWVLGRRKPAHWSGKEQKWVS